jgi:hypothetical protein
MHPIGKKKKAHQLTEVERLKEEIRVLKTKTPEYKELENRVKELKYAIDVMKDRFDNCMEDAGRYRVLRRKEIIIPDVEQGMIYASGAELDKLVDDPANPDLHTLLRQLIDAAALSSRPITQKSRQILTTAGMIEDAQQILNNHIKEAYLKTDAERLWNYETICLGFEIDDGRR